MHNIVIGIGIGIGIKKKKKREGFHFAMFCILRHCKVCCVSCEFIHENEHAQKKQTNERKKNNNSNKSNE